MPWVTLVDINKLLETGVHIQKVTEHDIYDTGTWVPYDMVSDYYKATSINLTGTE